ncbi:MAG: ABC transporter ATP-binding protein [Acidimicrobiia bacterium]|nr:ABC transporter ATP-binding protein [Acidimicrobiia bacterium]
MAAITLEHLRVVREDRLLLAIDHLDIPDGELLVVIGPSGAGKTTLLRAIAGLDAVTSGSIFFDGVDITKTETRHRGVAMVFQESSLFPFMDVRHNVSFPLELRKIPREEIDTRVEAEARVLAIEHLLAKHPGQLGAGHQQLVEAARALVRVPEVFLMDEPLARLDAQLREEMRREFRLLQEGYDVTTVFVTNDQQDAMVMADRVAVLRDGWIQQLAAPMTLYREPASKFVAQFIGSPPMQFIPGRLTAGSPGFWVTYGPFRLRAWAPSLAAGPETVEIGIRAEDIVEDPAGTEVEIGRGYFVGSHGFAQVQLTPDHWIEMRTPGVPPAPGTIMRIRMRRIHIFDPITGRALGHIDDSEV